LEDRESDGLYEHSQVFAADVPFPTSVLASQEGISLPPLQTFCFSKIPTEMGKRMSDKLYSLGSAKGISNYA